MMLALLVPFVLAAFLMIASRKAFFGFHSRREILLGVLLLFGLLVAVATPLWGAFRWLNAPGLGALWAFLTALALIFVDRLGWSWEWPILSPAEKWMLAAWAVFMGVLLFLAIYVAPNSWDAMTYHMSRVAHWQHQQDLAYYPTSIGRQLWTMPLAEYIILHAQILSGSDHWANVVQWVALAGCAIGVSLLAGMLGASRLGQVATLLMATAIPMGILESTSTQNDVVSALWIVIFLVLLLKWVQDGRQHILLVWMLLALGLAALTKGTVYLVVPAFLAMGLVLASRKMVAAGQLLGVVLGAVLLILLVVGPGHLKRTFAYNVSSSGIEMMQAQNKDMSPALFVSNFVRHAGVHLQTPFQRVNDVFIRAIECIHRMLGLSMRDPRVSVGDAGFLLAVSAYHEYYAGNFLHFWIGLACCLTLFLNRRFVHERVLKLYVAALFVSVLVFVGYLRWQPWISRLQLPLFFIMVPVMGVVLCRMDRTRRLVVGAGFLFLLAALPWLLKGKLKPMVGKKNIFVMSRDEQYFINRPYLFEPFQWATGVVRQNACRQVGLSIGPDDWEYPFWVLLKDVKGLKVGHVDMEGPSFYGSGSHEQPCVIIKWSNEVAPEKLELNGRIFRRAGYHRPLNLFLPAVPHSPDHQ